MSDIVPDPKTVDAMLECVVPSSEGGKLTKPGAVVRNPVRAIRQHATLAIRRLNKLNFEQIIAVQSSKKHVDMLDELIEKLSSSDQFSAQRTAGRLIVARQKMLDKIAEHRVHETYDANLRVLEMESGSAGDRAEEGLTPEQAIRMLSDMHRVKVTETKMQRTLEAQVG